MKYFVSITLFFFQFLFTDNLYDITIKTVDGNTIELRQFKGKKILILLLSPSSQDKVVSVNDVKKLNAKYQNSLVIIGISSIEAGFKAQDADKLKKLFTASGNNIIVTEGMKVNKGKEQVSLFQWLTNKDKNHHFDLDVQGIGSKFFINEEGELYAVMSPNFALSNPLIDSIISNPRMGKTIRTD